MSLPSDRGICQCDTLAKPTYFSFGCNTLLCFRMRFLLFKSGRHVFDVLFGWQFRCFSLSELSWKTFFQVELIVRSLNFIGDLYSGNNFPFHNFHYTATALKQNTILHSPPWWWCLWIVAETVFTRREIFPRSESLIVRSVSVHCARKPRVSGEIVWDKVITFLSVVFKEKEQTAEQFREQVLHEKVLSHLFCPQNAEISTRFSVWRHVEPVATCSWRLCACLCPLISNAKHRHTSCPKFHNFGLQFHKSGEFCVVWCSTGKIEWVCMAASTTHPSISQNLKWPPNAAGTVKGPLADLSSL